MKSRAPRIASLLPSSTEILCALGLEESLIGVTHECDYPPFVKEKPQLTASRISHERITSAEIHTAVGAQLDGHGSIYDLDEAKLYALKPDVIVTQELCDVCAVSYKTVKQAAARIFDGDVQVISLEPNTIADIFANITTLAALTGREAAAETVISDLTSRLDLISASLPSTLKRPRVLMLEWLEPPFLPGHWVPEQVAIAGGDSTFGLAGQPSRQTTAADIRAYDPETIVLIPCGYYREDILRALPGAQLPERWNELTAVRRGEVWALDATSYFSRPGPRVVDGAEILARILHPEIFGAPRAVEAARVPADLMRI